MNKSPKEMQLEKKLLSRLSGKPRLMAMAIFNDPEIQAMQEYANSVSIKRLGFNDHGPVHMRTAAMNALIMFELLEKAGIKFNLEREDMGTAEDSKVAVFAASMLHDFGMTVSRDKHELFSVMLGLKIIDRLLSSVYGDDIHKKVIVRSLIVEGIAGHMATQKIHSLEAGLVLIGDGCDMEKGRARITQMLATVPKIGDIHKYSASAIQKVTIRAGKEKPIDITVEMSQSVGFHQIEEVLYPKISSSPVKPYVELYAGVAGYEMMKYL